VEVDKDNCFEIFRAGRDTGDTIHVEASSDFRTWVRCGETRACCSYFVQSLSKDSPISLAFPILSSLSSCIERQIRREAAIARGWSHCSRSCSLRSLMSTVLFVQKVLMSMPALKRRIEVVSGSATPNKMPCWIRSWCVFSRALCGSSVATWFLKCVTVICEGQIGQR